MRDHGYFGNLIWQIADLLRGPYRPPQYERVMLPLTVLRRFDSVLAPTKAQVVLAQHREIDDPELGGRYTVKVYESEKVPTEDGGWRHKVIRLKPDSDDARFEPIVLENLDDGELTVIAELVEVLR
jgi:type I restriction-modification system DNA methylase subunit